MEREQLALDFVNSLVPNRFEEARAMLSPEAHYRYGDELLRGDAIIQSFIDNHEHALEKLDSVEYIDGVVSEISGNKISIVVKDRLSKAGTSYLYTDRLIIEIENEQVVSIEYKPFPEERAKLKEFFRENNIDF